jgi:hypothetical protein
MTVTVVQKGISLPALQCLLDHNRLTTTEIYLNLLPTTHCAKMFDANKCVDHLALAPGELAEPGPPFAGLSEKYRRASESTRA